MAAGVLPADLGVILSNVTSVAFVGQYFRTGVPLIQKRMTVDGDAVAAPKNIIAPIGAQIHDVIDFCGGYKSDPRKILMGGPMMGRAIFSDEMPIVKNNNAILAFSKEKSYIPEELHVSTAEDVITHVRLICFLQHWQRRMSAEMHRSSLICR